MPFIIRRIGGTEGHVGYAWAANMFGYMVCLLLAGLYFGRHNPKNTTRLSSAIVCTCAVIVGILIYTALYRNMEGNRALIWFIIASGTVAGGAMSLFWPFLMSWVSEDLEGSVLNRRLGNYNGAWTCAAMIGPVVGGILVDASKLLPASRAVGHKCKI